MGSPPQMESTRSEEALFAFTVVSVSVRGVQMGQTQTTAGNRWPRPWNRPAWTCALRARLGRRFLPAGPGGRLGSTLLFLETEMASLEDRCVREVMYTLDDENANFS